MNGGGKVHGETSRRLGSENRYQWTVQTSTIRMQSAERDLAQTDDTVEEKGRVQGVKTAPARVQTRKGFNALGNAIDELVAWYRIVGSIDCMQFDGYER